MAVSHVLGTGPAVVAPVGRDGEVHTVVQAARAVSAGRGSAVLVMGEAGIGKTTLVRSLVPALAALGLQVCIGAADVLESRLPFSAIGDCLDLRRRCPDPRRAAVAARIRGVPGDLAASAAPADEAALAEEVIAVVEDLCESGPLALVLDDAQWADPASLLCLQRISRLVEQLPLLLTLAVRSGQSTPGLDHLTARMAQRGATTIVLGPLGAAGVAELLARLTGAAPGTGLRRLAADAAGNPFYITALVDALQAGQHLHITKEWAETEQETGPGSLHAVIMQRLDFLPASVVETLRAAALLGSRFSAGELAAATGQSPLELCPLLELATGAGILVQVAEHLAFRHDLVRQTLEQSLSVSTRQAMHQRLGLGLAAAGHPVERVADQLRRCGPTLGEAGLDWLASTVEHLAARDHGAAVELLERALPAADPADPRVQRLRVVLACALLHQGRSAECLRVATQALATMADPDLRSQLRWVLVHQAQADRGMGSLRAAQEAAAHSDTSPGQRLRFSAHVALQLAEFGEYEQARQTAEAVRASATGPADAAAHVQALTTLALLAANAKKPREALALADQALRFPGRNRTLDAFRATALLDLGRWKEARAVFDQHHSRATAPESVAEMLYDHVYSAWADFIGGLWDDASAEIEASCELPEHADARRALCGLGALIALHRDNIRAAQNYLADAPVHSPYTPDDRFSGSFPRWAHARYEQYRGRTVQALQLFEYLCHHDCRDLQAIWLANMAPETVRLALEAGDQARAHQMYAFILDQAARAEPGVLDPGPLHCQGLVDARADALLAAADAYRALHRPWQHARCHEDTGLLLARRDHVDDARHELHLAATGYQALDAAWDRARVDAELRALGVRRGVRGPRRRPSHGWDSLTNTELKVAALVAEGLSNPHIAERLFISRRTVQTHVSHILTKLGLTSRVEIATRAASHSTL